MTAEALAIFIGYYYHTTMRPLACVLLAALLAVASLPAARAASCLWGSGVLLASLH